MNRSIFQRGKILAAGAALILLVNLGCGQRAPGEGKESDLSAESPTPRSHDSGSSESQGSRGGNGQEGIPPWPKDSPYQRKPEPVQWKVLGTPNRTTVSIGNWVGWCPGSGPLPKIKGVRQVDHPHFVTLTAFLINHPPKNCPGVETGADYLVHIRGGLRGRALYDGSQSPPKKRWPR